MALKDWKKVTDKKDLIHYYNSKRKLSVFIYYQDYIKALKRKNHWVFELANSKKTYKEVITKTKTMAKRYAMNYMKNN